MRLHLAALGEGGCAFVVESWTSREAQAEFMQNRPGPAMAQGGVTATPKVTWATLIADHHPGNDLLNGRLADGLAALLYIGADVENALFWLPSMKGSVKGMAPALLRVRRRWSVSTSFVWQGGPR